MLIFLIDGSEILRAAFTFVHKFFIDICKKSLDYVTFGTSHISMFSIELPCSEMCSPSTVPWGWLVNSKLLSLSGILIDQINIKSIDKIFNGTLSSTYRTSMQVSGRNLLCARYFDRVTNLLPHSHKNGFNPVCLNICVRKFVLRRNFF